VSVNETTAFELWAEQLAWPLDVAQVVAAQ
jgi:hypothetical protein